MGHHGLRAVQQSLAARGVIAQSTTPYHDGRTRYKVYPRGEQHRARFTDDVDELYIMGLRF